MISKCTNELLQALKAGNYNAPPARTRDGCIMYFGPDDPHSLDLLWSRTMGYPGYSPYPPQDTDFGESPRTPEQIREVEDAILKWCDEQCFDRSIEFKPVKDVKGWIFVLNGSNLFAPPAPLDVAVKELKAYLKNEHAVFARLDARRVGGKLS